MIFPIGTRSVLFGVHQFVWHPFTVLLAWRKLYRSWPTWREAVAIVLHDIGYISKPSIDGPEGKSHPYLGALWAGYLVGALDRMRGHGTCYIEANTGQHAWFALDIFELCAFHSRDFARDQNRKVSRLYAADKYCVFYDPFWLYRLRARLSGELDEFKQNAIRSGHLHPGATDREWFDFYRANVLARPEIQELLNK